MFQKICQSLRDLLWHKYWPDMAAEKSGKNVSSYASLAMPLDGDTVRYTTLSPEFFVVCDLCGYKNMI